MNKQVYEVTVSANGTVRYRQNGKLHNEHGPAVTWADGTVLYYLNGKFHNDKGPALRRDNGYVEYWLNDKRVTEAQVMKPLDGTIIEKDGVQYRLTAV